jgi:uncharacterized membrane protein YbhN (UPF0104 family)
VVASTSEVVATTSEVVRRLPEWLASSKTIRASLVFVDSTIGVHEVIEIVESACRVSSPPPEPGHKRLAKRLFAWALALAALTFVIVAVPIRDRCANPADPRTCQAGLASVLGHARLAPLAAILAMYLASTLAWATRWRVLVTLAGARVTLAGVWRVTLEAQAGGVLLPGGVGGDALRVAGLMGRGAPVATVIASVLLDRFVGLATLAGIGGGLALAMGVRGLGALAPLLASFPLGLVAGLALLRVPALGRATWLERPLFQRTAKPVLEYLHDPRAPRAIAFAFLPSLFVSAVQLIVIRALLYSLGETPADEGWMYMGSALAFMVSAVPALPGAWGTGDAAFVFFLGQGGVTPSAAFAVCLLYRLFWYVSAAIGAFLYVTRRS